MLIVNTEAALLVLYLYWWKFKFLCDRMETREMFPPSLVTPLFPPPTVFFNNQVDINRVPVPLNKKINKLKLEVKIFAFRTDNSISGVRSSLHDNMLVNMEFSNIKKAGKYWVSKNSCSFYKATVTTPIWKRTSWTYCMCFLLVLCYRNFAVMDDIIDEIKEDFLYLSKDRSMPGAQVKKKRSLREKCFIE